MENKDTKARLSELMELYKEGYVSENELKIARFNILREGGIDITLRYSTREDEEELTNAGGCGCGCFLASLLLLSMILGGIFFAAPFLPDKWGGNYARVVREKISSAGTGIMSWFGEDVPPDPSRKPDPVESSGGAASHDVLPVPHETEPEEVSVSDDAVKPSSEDNAVIPAPASTTSLNLPIPSLDHERERTPLTPLDMHILSMPSSEPAITAEPVVTAEPAVTTVEIQPSAGVTDIDYDSDLKCRVTATRARIRSTPDTFSHDNVVGYANAGEIFTVLKKSAGKDGSNWYYINYGDGSKQGWISAYVAKLEDN